MSLKRSMCSWLRRFAGLFRKRQRDAELTAELESHLQLHIEETCAGERRRRPHGGKRL